MVAPPDPNHAELVLKRHELIQREYQILGDYLKEVRSLGASIGTMTLAIAGGMLTLSVGQVLRGDGVELPGNLFCVLHFGWAALFVAIAAVVAWAFNLAVAMANHSKRWRESLENGIRLVQPSTSETVGWVIAGIGLAGLLTGLGLLTYVAVNIPQKPSTAKSATPSAIAPSPAAPASTASSRPSGS